MNLPLLSVNIKKYIQYYSYSAVNIYSLKINTSLIMMRECLFKLLLEKRKKKLKFHHFWPTHTYIFWNLSLITFQQQQQLHTLSNITQPNHPIVPVEAVQRRAHTGDVERQGVQPVRDSFRKKREQVGEIHKCRPPTPVFEKYFKLIFHFRT